MQVGRPKKFDQEAALDCALKVFWRQGYEGTSLTDLTREMGINRPSLYATFGDKESLFRMTVERYMQIHAEQIATALSEPTARKVVERLLISNVALSAEQDRPRGCFLVQGALTCSEDSNSVQSFAAKARSQGQLLLRQRLERAKIEGDLPKSADAVALALYVSALNYGLSVLANGGASTEELSSAAQVAIKSIKGSGLFGKQGAVHS